jgi:hypothetical protein
MKDEIADELSPEQARIKRCVDEMGRVVNEILTVWLAKIVHLRDALLQPGML